MGRTQELRTIYVVIPSYGDNRSVLEITSEINSMVDGNLVFCILDDSAGVDKYPKLASNFHIFIPKSNMGQQKILVNFFRHTLPTYFNHTPNDLVLILDGDGEDAPININKMLMLLDENKVEMVVATRGKRHVKALFKIGYVFFQVFGFVLCNRNINHGTFSISKRAILEKATKSENFDYSFVGGMISSKMTKRKLKCDRHPRRYGRSNLNKINLISYGLRVYAGIRPKVSYKIFQITSVLIVILSLMNLGENLTVENFQITSIFKLILYFYLILNTCYLPILIFLKVTHRLYPQEKFVLVNRAAAPRI
jgi:hypothetical protein